MLYLPSFEFFDAQLLLLIFLPTFFSIYLYPSLPYYFSLTLTLPLSLLLYLPPSLRLFLSLSPSLVICSRSQLVLPIGQR